MEQVFITIMSAGTLHAFILAAAAFTGRTGQLFDYGSILLEFERVINRGVAESIEIRKLLRGKVRDTSEVIISEVVIVQVLFIPVMRFTSVAPIFLYFISFVVFGAKESGVDFSGWDSGCLIHICVFAALGLQVTHICLKIFSGMAQHLMAFHPKYAGKSVIAIVTDWTSFK